MFTKPILLIIFNRPDTSARVFEVIRKLRPSRLYIAADGPRSNRSGEMELCLETRRLASLVDWPCEVKTRFLDENLGCHVAVPEAITWFFDNEEMGVILEDDCLADISFFSFCEELLEKYRGDEKIMMISGDNFQASDFKVEGGASYYFSSYVNIWGWATWRRAWQKFSNDFKKLNDSKMKSEIGKSFFSYQEKKYWYGFYKKLKYGRLINWDAKWSLSLVYNSGLSLVPSVNLVENIGFGAGATHSAGDYYMAIAAKSIFNIIHPANREINRQADNYLFKLVYFNSIFKRLYLKIKFYFKKYGKL